MKPKDKNPIGRSEPEVLKEFEKNVDDENFISHLNDVLEPSHSRLLVDTPETYSTVHVIGVPRSGTTLLAQLLSSHLDIGNINNLVAAFWKVPLYGIRLSRKLIDADSISSYRSTFGRTRGLHEPHEFGYFWFSLLKYKEMVEQPAEHESSIDWSYLSILLRNMCEAYKKPVLFKNFLVGWHIRTLSKVLPKTCFVRVRRDPLDNALSILAMREKFLGSKETWASMKPRQYAWLKDEPYWVQVAGQVHFLERCMSEQLCQIASDNVLDISYETLCCEPGQVLREVSEMLERNGNGHIEIKGAVSSFETRRGTELPVADCEKVKQALQRFSSGEFD